MRLKKIDLRGFKSFPDKTTISFKRGITGVVGPNGSGKSNISDAVRWVLGEQSAKTLRGSKMEDIIFSGTEKRKPLGFCEVTITLDNKSGKIPIDYEEVGITRRVFRTGESEYYINKNGCRLRDIRELFMDTGIGKEGYSIIGQGRIDEILSDRPEDRRSIFEEAAGIVKYKSKKEESERKLVRTQDNLTRVSDLVSELKSREKSLKNQAEKAIEYEKIYSELKKLNINIYINDIDEANKRKSIIAAKIKKINKELKKYESEKELVTDNLKEIRIYLDKNQINSNSKNDEKHRRLIEIETERNKLELLDEKEKFNLKDLKRLKLEDKSSRSNISKKEDENKEIKNKINILQSELKKMAIDFEKENKDLKDKTKRIKQEENNLENNKNQAMDIYNSISDNRSQLNSIISFNENISKRTIQLKKSIEEQEDVLETEVKNSEINKNIKNNLEVELKELKEKILFDNNKLNSIEDKFNILEKQINEINIEIQTNISNYKLYKNMEDSYEGYYRGVREILKTSEKNDIINKNLIGVVADLITIKEKHEIAISTSLGGSSQNIVTWTQNGAKLIIDYLRQNRLGRVTCLPLDTIRGRKLNLNDKDRLDYKVIGIASEIIEYEEKYENIMESLLGRTIIVEDMNNGIKLSNKYNNSLRIVTIEGDVINPGGSMTGGSQGKNSSNILSRKNRIDRIEQHVKKSRVDKENLEKEKIEIESNLEKKKDEILKLQEFIQNKEYKLLNLTNKINNQTEDIIRVEGSISNQKLEINSLKEEVDNYEEKKEEIQQNIEKLNIELKNIQISTEKLTTEVEEMKKFNEKLTNKNMDKKIVINRREDEIFNLKERFEENINSITYNKLGISDKLKSQSNINEELTEIKKEVKKTNIKIVELEEKLKTLENTILNIELEKKELNLKLKNNEANLENLLKSIAQLEKKYSEKELNKAKEKLKIESLYERFLSEYEIDYETAKEYKDKSLDMEESRELAKKLNIEIKKLGTVNLGSIEEYKELSNRLDFISDQQKDLSKAQEDLKKVIRGIEIEMNEKFMNSFSLIKENFSEIFKVLFNGGQANLLLSDKEDILNTGIEIEAQPPGKRLQNLTSLSGGERSLTAVALLFAILKMKPSPFCILDEIDAALDEANITRYTNYLREISDKMQFIIITHRKRTMEVADTLYGVTMEEKGVSKLLSIELTEYEEEVS